MPRTKRMTEDWTTEQGQWLFLNALDVGVPDSLMEAELFGYAEGAFTGAKRKGRRGVIEMGQGGTVFLDEIGDMPIDMQAKLLTVIQNKEIRRLGARLFSLFVARRGSDPLFDNLDQRGAIL